MHQETPLKPQMFKEFLPCPQHVPWCSCLRSPEPRVWPQAFAHTVSSAWNPLPRPHSSPSSGQTPLRLSSSVPCTGGALRTQRCPTKHFLTTQISPQLPHLDSLTSCSPKPIQGLAHSGCSINLYCKGKIGTNIPDHLHPPNRLGSGLICSHGSNPWLCCL